MSSNTSITVQQLGKLYRIGGPKPMYRTLRESIAGTVGSFFRRIRHPIIADRSRTFWALRNVSFELREGDVLGIIGRNGAGKSTLLKILSRITYLTEGHVEIQGRVGSLLEVGTGFHPELTGRENTFLNGSILGMSRSEIRRKFDEIVAFAEIEGFIDTPVKHYSSGMYTRLAFSVAAHLEPEILVVDEVLAVGDALFQKKCLGKMGEVAGKGRTILFVSHNMAAIKSLCTRAILLESGQIRIDGSVQEAVSHYFKTQSATTNGWVPADSPRIGSGEAKLLRVTLQDTKGDCLDRLYLGQRFRIAVTYEIQRPLAQSAIEIGISTSDGIRIATVCNMDESRPAFSFDKGTWEVTAAFDLTLLPGEYFVDAFIQDLDRNLTLDWVDRSLKFSALGVSENGTDHYRWGVVRGHVRPHTEWSNPVEAKTDNIQPPR